MHTLGFLSLLSITSGVTFHSLRENEEAETTVGRNPGFVERTVCHQCAEVGKVGRCSLDFSTYITYSSRASNRAHFMPNGFINRVVFFTDDEESDPTRMC